MEHFINWLGLVVGALSLVCAGILTWLEDGVTGGVFFCFVSGTFAVAVCGSILLGLAP